MERRQGIGGTDIGAIIGVNPWKSQMDVYLDKVGITESPEDNEAMYWGREMEPVLAKRYEKETKYKVEVPLTEFLPMQHPKYEWYLGSPDGLIFKPTIGGVDFKTTGRRNDYGTPGTDEVPEWVHTQADWYKGLTEAEWWDIAVLFFAPRREFAIYRIPRNQELIDNLIEAGKDFWESHVIPQIPPPIDASEGSKRLLNYLYPKDIEDLIPATAGLEKLTELLKTQETIRDQAIEELTLTQNQIKEAIGDHAGVISLIGKITWKQTKDRETVDWRAAFDGLLGLYNPTPEQFQKITEMVSNHKKTTPSSRVFRTYWKKEE